jgi:hypothetical protein
LDYRANFGTALGLMQRSAQVMGMFLPGHEFVETQNKLEAFRLFAYADQELGFPTHRLEPLASLTRRALALGKFERIWALEGVAHYFASRANSPERILCDAELPEAAMVPMHAGMGTAFAGAALAGLGAKPAKASLRDAMERFFELCRANARAGWYENAIEPMGLATRTLHPHLLANVSDAIGEIDACSQRLFWHGVGRSLYFVPMNFMTFGGSHERALRSAIDEAPTLENRRNAVAGLVWAVTLVNIRHPAVLKNLLRAAAPVAMRDAVINGITSALLVWRHMVPEDREFGAAYTRRLPVGARGADDWNNLVVIPAARALATEDQRIAALFQYRARA